MKIHGQHGCSSKKIKIVSGRVLSPATPNERSADEKSAQCHTFLGTLPVFLLDESFFAFFCVWASVILPALSLSDKKSLHRFAVIALSDDHDGSAMSSPSSSVPGSDTVVK